MSAAPVTTDPRAMAHELANSVGLCGGYHLKMYGRHSVVCYRIEFALHTARNTAQSHRNRHIAFLMLSAAS